MRRTTILTAASWMFVSGALLIAGDGHIVKPAQAMCHGGGPSGWFGNPGNSKPVGRAGEHPPGNPTDQTGDRGHSR